MKTMKSSVKYLFATITLGLVFTSCGDSFLVRDPYGSTITQGQYEKLANQLEGSMRGIYSMMYEYSDHDEFGKRSIDMYTDIMSGDMALTNYTYGWFYTDEQGQSRTSRTGYLWIYYYSMLHNVNAVLNAAQGGGAASADNVIKRIAVAGLPNKVGKSGDAVVYYTVNPTTGDTLATYTETEAEVANCYAQALTIRGYIYSNLLQLYCNPSRTITSLGGQLCFPMYNEINMNEPQPLADMEEVYNMLENDLTVAIDYFDAFSEITRNSKLEVDKSIACGILAYSYLNKGKPQGTDAATQATFTNARDYALMAIASSPAQIISNKDVLENGFNNVNNTSWMWGQQVTVETSSGLGSWFGQCDIHSYSYAWSGDTKAIDENLYKMIPDYDIRKFWFNDGKENSTYKYCPDGKFFSASNPKSTKSDDIDREWLSDNVYMRIESMYLIASEASYRLGNEMDALNYLNSITDQRITPGMDSAYLAHKDTLTGAALLAEISYNWRVELWGEGYGLQTFRRLDTDVYGAKKRKRGANHCANGGSEMDPLTSEYTFQIPASEGSYNPKINTTRLP